MLSSNFNAYNIFVDEIDNTIDALINIVHNLDPINLDIDIILTNIYNISIVAANIYNAYQVAFEKDSIYYDMCDLFDIADITIANAYDDAISARYKVIDYIFLFRNIYKKINNIISIDIYFDHISKKLMLEL
jgi:hypothetical protein